MGSVGRALGLVSKQGASNISGVSEAQTEAKRLKEAAEKQSLATQAQQQRLIGGLQGQVEGSAPSLAQAQLKAAQDRNLAQQLAAAKSQRGGSPAALQRQLARAQGSAGQELAQQAGQARLQEQQGAQQLLAQQLGQQQALSSGQVSGFLGQGQQFAANQARLRAQQAQADAAATGSFLGAGASALGSMFAKSDENSKKNIKKDSKSSNDFLEKLSSVSYKYKDTSEPGTAEGKRHGILAQDLEKSEVGKSLVLNTPGGKMVDTVQGFGAVLAAQSELHKRLKELESKKKKG